MNVEARRPSSSDEVESASIDLTEISSTNSSKQKSQNTSSQNSDTSSISSKSSISRSDATGALERKENAPTDPKDSRPEIEQRSKSSVSSSSKESIEDKSKSRDFALVNGDIEHSDSGSYVKENHSYASSSIVSESDKGLLRSILSDSSSEKIITDIDAASPKDGKFSSSTDEELLRKFREQQANRRFRPRSAKYRRDADPEPETVQRVHSRASDKSSSKDSYYSDSSDQEQISSGRRKRQAKKTRKASSSSASKSSVSKKGDVSSRSPSPRSSTHSGNEEPQREKAQQTAVEKTTKQPLTKTTAGSETSDSLTTSATSPSESTLRERPPSRQGKRPKLYPRKHSPTRTKSERTRSLRRVRNKKSETLLLDSRANCPNQSGFWWPYNEDAGEREIRRHIEYHKRKYHSLLAQEYLQRHLEIELRRSGAQFKQYERGPRPISPKQVRKFKEKNVTWIYLDGKLYNLKNDMGSWNTTQRGRQRNKVIPKKNKAASRSRSRERSSKSSQRPKRSVSFEKGAGRRVSSARSADGNPLTNLIKGLSPRRKKKKTKRRGSGSSSRKSSLSSRSSARTVSRSSSRTSQSGHGPARGKPSRSSSAASRSGSRSSSKGSKSSSRGLISRLSPKRDKSPRAKQTERPKTAHRPKSATFGRIRSTSSNSKSSVDRSSSKERGEKKKKSKSGRRSSSSTTSEKKGKKSKDSSNHKDIHYRIDEDQKLDRVLFTDDYERKLKKAKRERETAKLPPGIYDTTHHTVESTPSLGRRGDRPRTAHPPDRRPMDDYNFYRDPNIPGHAFPYYYLSYLLAMEGKNKKRSGENGVVARIVLKPAPVNKPPVWRTHSAKPRRPAPKPRQSERSPSTSPKSRRKKKTKSVIKEKQEEKLARSSSRESGSPSLNHSSSVGSHPRIRPGSGPIKCSWKSQTEPEKPKFPGSDHQLKNTDNPEILDWLRRKDAQLRARRQNEIRKHRRKTEKLIDEQYDLEDKHERALRQYEMWKKTKDREILLRRRKEAKEANSAIFTRRENELKMIKRKERPRTASNGPQKADERSTFSELRSSSARPNNDDRTKARKQRPKSANTVEVSLGHDQVETPSLRPKSATPPRKSDADNTKRQSVFQRTENFFKSFLGVDGTQTKGKHAEANHAPDKPVVTVAAEERDAYDKWVRSGSPSTRDSSKTEGKKKTKASAPGRSKNKQRGHKLRLPPHDHSDNDLISNLAKRRIESILSSRKGVDLKKRPKSGMHGLRQPTPPAGSRN